jgi:hypothetical protein
MSYGQNAPWGLQPIRMINNASWNQQLSTYLIPSGYAQNIFAGDVVYISSSGPYAGYIRNLYDINGNAYTDQPTLGVFQGCSFAVPTAVNPIDPANPGRPYWPSGTATMGNVPAVAFIITDPSVVYNAQTAAGRGAAQTDVRTNVAVSYSQIAGQVQGNFSNGTSSLTVLMGGGGAWPTPILNCYVDALSSNVNNVAGQEFNNVEVVIANHYFRVMPSLGNLA